MIEEKDNRISTLESEMLEVKKRLDLLLKPAIEGPEVEVTVGFVQNEGINGTELYQNRPNPFRQNTTFSYSLANEGKVDLSTYSMEGVLIETIASGTRSKGDHNVEWDSKEIPNGMYFYILNVDGVEWVKKAIRLR